MATMALNGAPETAFAMAWRTAHVVNTLVDRPIHVAIVKGFKRKLYTVSNGCACPEWALPTQRRQ